MWTPVSEDPDGLRGWVSTEAEMKHVVTAFEVADMEKPRGGGGGRGIPYMYAYWVCAA